MLFILFALVVSAVCQAAPSITEVYPTVGQPGDHITIRIRGDDTDFTDGLSQTVFSGTGITVNFTYVVDSTHVIADINVDQGAAYGSRDVNVVTGAEVPAPLVGGFFVWFYPLVVSSITPDTGLNTGVVEVTDLVGANFRDGAQVTLRKSGETDIQASNVSVVSGERITCDFDLTGADNGYWDVTVVNTDGANGSLMDAFQVTGVASLPSIALIKTGPDFATQGDQIAYTFTVNNTGNDSLDNVGVTDSLLWEGTHQIGYLPVNGSSTFQKTYIIPDSATDTVENDSTVTGTDRSGHDVTDSNSHTVFLETGLITLLKLGPGSAKAGDAVTYDFTIYNNSAEDFTGVRVTDPLFGDDWSQEVGDVAAHGQASFSVDYTIPDGTTIPFTNTATVTATDAYGLEVTDTSSYTTIAPSPAGSCTANSLAPSPMPPNAWWVFLVLVPLVAVGGLRWRYTS